MGKKKAAPVAGGIDEIALYQTDEGRKKLQQLNLTKLKNRQQEEERLSKLNNFKLQTRWREILREEKARNVLSDLEVGKQGHERQLDLKDTSIERRDRDLEEAEHQYQDAVQTHLMNVDNLIAVQVSRMETAQRHFDQELALLNAEFNNEKYRIHLQVLSDRHQKEKTELQGIITRMEQEFQEAEAEAKHEHQSMRDDVKNKNLEEKHALRIQLEGVIDDLWRQFQRALDDYNQSTEERKMQFETLKEKDLESSAIIENQMKRVSKLQDTITHLKARITGNAREFEERNKSLRAEKDALQTHFQELKRKMNLYRENERKKLIELTVLSNRVVGQLKTRVETAQNILKLAEMNSKLESEEETILRHQSSDLDGDTLKQLKEEQERQQEALDNGTGLLHVEEKRALRQFYQRYNKVVLDKYALDAHMRVLQTDNDNLRSVLKEYLEGISVSEAILAKKNPLLVVNGKTNVPYGLPTVNF